jgi:hypothetical protein
MGCGPSVAHSAASPALRAASSAPSPRGGSSPRSPGVRGASSPKALPRTSSGGKEEETLAEKLERLELERGIEPPKLAGEGAARFRKVQSTPRVSSTVAHMIVMRY